MNRLGFAFAILATAAVSHSATFTFTNTGDTFINGTSAGNANTAFGGDFQGSALGAQNQFWMKFDGAEIRRQLTAQFGSAYTINSVALRVSAGEANNNSTIQFVHNTNGMWQTPATRQTNQNAATTAFLTWNTAGQSASTNARFLGMTAQVGEYFVADRTTIVGATGAIFDVNFTQNLGNLLGNIANGESFSIFARTATGQSAERLTLVTSEGVTPYAGQDGRAHIAPTLVIDAVPEPATFAVLGLGALSLLRRRKNAR